MKKIFAILILLLISACQPTPSDIPALLPPSPAPAPLDTEPPPTLDILQSEVPADAATPVCGVFQPMQDDIDRSLSFPGKFFDTPDWERNYTVTSQSVQVSWNNPILPALAYLETYIFPCGYEEPDLDDFFNLDSWKIIFDGYQSYEYITQCRNDNGLRLYEFAAADEDTDYSIRYWALNDTDRRVLTMMLVVPADMPQLMDDYSYALFPQLTECP
ncbi:hypothetical protein MASR2M66_12290 [Chloroflexota bacterium]